MAESYWTASLARRNITASWCACFALRAETHATLDDDEKDADTIRTPCGHAPGIPSWVAATAGAGGAAAERMTEP